MVQSASYPADFSLLPLFSQHFCTKPNHDISGEAKSSRQRGPLLIVVPPQRRKFKIMHMQVCTFYCAHTHIYLYICTSIYLSFFISFLFCLSVCLSVYLSIYLSICTCTCTFICICICKCLYVYVSMCIYIYTHDVYLVVSEYWG